MCVIRVFEILVHDTFSHLLLFLFGYRALQNNVFVTFVDRHPIPDYYSITLELSRDRTTTARAIECSNQNPALPDCPAGNVDGDVILQRDINNACTQMVSVSHQITPITHNNPKMCSTINTASAYFTGRRQYENCLFF